MQMYYAVGPGLESRLQARSEQHITASKCLVDYLAFCKFYHRITPVPIQHRDTHISKLRLAFRQRRYGARRATTGNIQVTHKVDNVQVIQSFNLRKCLLAQTNT